MRILHLESGMNWGGQEYRTLQEVEWLNRNGHFSALVCQPGSGISRYAKKAGVPLIEMKIRNGADIKAIARVWSFCRKNKIDLLHTHSSKDSWICFPLHLAGYPVIRSRHINLGTKTGLSRAFIFRHGCRRVIATAHVIRNDLVQRYKVSPEKIDVVGEGVDLNRFSGADGRSFRAKWNLPDNAPLLGIIGMIRGEKGHRQFIEAAIEALKLEPQARFVVVGEGTGARQEEMSLRQRVETLFGSATCNTPVILTGYESDVPGVLAALDVVAMPSLMEAQSRVVPEAFASGKPVIASRVGGLPELVEHEKNGLLVPPGDVPALAQAMIRLIRSPELRRELATAALETARSRLSMEEMMRNTLEVYGRALQPNSGK